MSTPTTSCKEVFLVYGWKIGPEHYKNALTGISEEVLATGLQVVFAKDATKAAFAGKVLLRLAPADSGTCCSVPSPADLERLRHGMQLAGMESVAQETPSLWMVAG